ncbi:hypothetical protein [Sulfuricaulis limicola]|uniref:hypothetical protein n=1 Tax=Sulfuricaulis limicola TaxID=1620215 RepID=UPI0011E4CDC7|nr:hypothetical protein [Sulfuricaulis limicola]
MNAKTRVVLVILLWLAAISVLVFSVSSSESLRAWATERFSGIFFLSLGIIVCTSMFTRDTIFLGKIIVTTEEPIAYRISATIGVILYLSGLIFLVR